MCVCDREKHVTNKAPSSQEFGFDVSLRTRMSVPCTNRQVCNQKSKAFRDFIQLFLFSFSFFQREIACFSWWVSSPDSDDIAAGKCFYIGDSQIGDPNVSFHHFLEKKSYILVLDKYDELLLLSI